jgi:hypothetical protein
MLILEKVLNKLGVNSIDQLSETERNTFNEWEKILSGKSITLENLLEYTQQQMWELDDKIDSPDNTEKQDWFYRCERKFWRKLHKIIANNESYKKYLTDTLKKQYNIT